MLVSGWVTLPSLKLTAEEPESQGLEDDLYILPEP